MLGILSVLSLSMLATDAYGQTLEIFSAVPEGTEIPPIPFSIPTYTVDSEMVTVDVGALAPGSISLTVFGQTHIIPNGEIEQYDDGESSWVGRDGNGTSAILVYDDETMFGFIHIPGKTFEIFPVSGTIHVIYDTDTSRLPPTSNDNSLAGAQGTAGQINQDQISRLESAYISGIDYDGDSDNMVTIDVYVIFTPGASEEYPGALPSRMSRAAMLEANEAYRHNNLPVRLSLVEYDILAERTYEDAGNIRTDLNNLAGGDRDFANYVEMAAAGDEADITVMLVKDYDVNDKDGDGVADVEETDEGYDDNRDLLNTCGKAGQQLARSTDTAIAVVETACIRSHTFTNVIGWMHGAGYDTDSHTNREFSYGHGYYHEGVGKRTVMSGNEGNCNNPITRELEICNRVSRWSDPFYTFIPGFTPSGTVDLNWNARVVFATAPHLASLRGPAQTYDDTRPTGSITLPPTIPTSGNLELAATFSEDIHPRFPPYITITDGTTSTTGVMTRLTPTTYEYSHILDREDGRYNILFSNARDLFGNDVAKTPTSGDSVTLDASRLRTADPAPGSTARFTDDFQSGLSKWTLGGDSNWEWIAPREGVVLYEYTRTNKVMASTDCDSTCIATINSKINTEEPLVISFDRFVDDRVSNDEGLHLQYSVDDGTTWSTLVSYTDRNGKATEEWEHEIVDMTIPKNTASIRFLADSDRARDFIEVDNFNIMRPPHAVPDVMLDAVLDTTRARILVSFTEDIPHRLQADDFEIDTGTLTRVSHARNSGVATLYVSGIPYNTGVVVTYTGDTIPVAGVYLNTGTKSSTNVIAPPDSTPPVLTAPADITAEATGQLTSVNIGTARATDNLDTTPTITNDAPSGGYLIGITTVIWTATDDYGNSAVARQTITVRDTTAPTITAPQDVTADSTGQLTPVNIGTATATDVIDQSPAITNDAPSGGYPIGTTTITWTATDDYNNAASATQTVTIRGGTSDPITINAPETLTIAAKGILTGYSLTADAPGAATLTNDAPEYFAFGNTTVTWTATDSLGNTATSETLVTVSPDSLDADWQYRLAGQFPSIAMQKSYPDPSQIVLASSDIGYGSVFLFKTFDKSEISGGDILIDAHTRGRGLFGIMIMDGPYSNLDASDFGYRSITGRGGGDLYIGNLINGTVTPDWSKSVLDEVTVILFYGKLLVSTQLVVDSVEFPGHSKWTFDDHIVDQKYLYGRYVLAGQDRTVYDLPVSDSFDSGLDGWTYWGSLANHTIRHDPSGSPSGSAYVTGEGFGIYSGIGKLVDVSDIGDDRLVVSYDYRAASTTPHSSVTNTRLAVSGDSGGHVTHPVLGGTTNTGWQTYTQDITEYAENQDTLLVAPHFYDTWVADYAQANWYDNIRIYTLDQATPVPTANTYVPPTSGQSGMVANATDYEIPEDMDAGIRVEDADDTRLSIAWDAIEGVEYKVVIAPAGEPRNKFSDLTYDDTYTFVNLAPETWYDVSVGVRGDDSTKYRMVAMTLSADIVAPDDLVLRASAVPGTDRISAEWDDDNGMGGNAYRVERSIHGGETASLRLTQDHTIHDDILPDWLGQTISYTVFERAGSQKIYSNEVSIILPDALEPPQNVRAEALDGTIQLSWDEAPIARNYLVDGLVDGQWLRIDKIRDSQLEYAGPADAFRITTQLGPAESAPSETVSIRE